MESCYPVCFYHNESRSFSEFDGIADGQRAAQHHFSKGRKCSLQCLYSEALALTHAFHLELLK